MSRKAIWDTLDKLEGVKGTYKALQKEKRRQGYGPLKTKALQRKKK
jgi:hypothetical protein